MGYKKVITLSVLVVATGVSIISIVAIGALAATPASDFSLQVTPSPLVATIKPGESTDLELKIRNAGTGTEELKIEPRSFTVDNKTGQINLNDTAPPEIAPWISFSSPKFTVEPGQWSTEKVHIALPKDTGFSYSLALVISRTKNEKATNAGRLIKGSVAVFTLLNVDRPGATRKLELIDFTASESVYEYLPAHLNISLKNTGNTIIQPSGNVFIQRGSTDKIPIATLPVNDKHGYLLPGSPRTLDAEWNTGFPVFTTSTDPSGEQKPELTWDITKLADFRIGRYTAKLVAVYSDGQRDIPIEREITFWVFPWRTIFVITFAIGLLGYLGHKLIQRNTRRAVKRAIEERPRRAR